MTRTADVVVSMRDGTTLRADVYRPATSQAVPVILMRTQYGKEAAQVQPLRYQRPDWFASHCYLVVVQDIRGQFASAGTFSEFTDDRNDGYDSVEWAARLAGSSGKVGMYGSSYVGATQWLAAETAPPHLTTIVPANTASDYDDGWTYENGAFRLNFIEPWAMETIALSAAKNRGDTEVAQQLSQDIMDIATWLRYAPYRSFPPFHPGDGAVAPYFYDWIAHRTDGPYWQQWAPQQHYPEIDYPGTAHRGLVRRVPRRWCAQLHRHGRLRRLTFARNNQRIVIGPWDHISWGRPDSPAAPMLKQIGPVGNSPDQRADAGMVGPFPQGRQQRREQRSHGRLFRDGRERLENRGGLATARHPVDEYYLSSDGHASSVMGDGQLVTSPPATGQQPDTYDYDPRNPVPSVGGHSCCAASGGSQGPV